MGFFCGSYESSHLQGCLINMAPEASSPVPWSPQLSTWEAHQGIKEGKTNGACKGIMSFWGAKAKALEGPYEALSSSSFVCLCNSLVPGRSSAAQLWILHPHQEEKSAGLEQDLILGFSRNNKAKPS